jgi:hypothetical protein
MQLDSVGRLSQYVSSVDPDLIVSGHFWAIGSGITFSDSDPTFFLDKNSNLILKVVKIRR